MRYFLIERAMFFLGVLGAFSLGLSWLTRGDRSKLCSAVLIVPLLGLMVLSLDGGLTRSFSQISTDAARLGWTWPTSRTTVVWCRAAPLVLAFTFAAWALWVLAKARFPLRLTVATVPVAAVAVLQGLLRLPAFSSWWIARVITACSGNTPWAMIPAVVPGVTVLLAVVLVLCGPLSQYPKAAFGRNQIKDERAPFTSPLDGY